MLSENLPTCALCSSHAYKSGGGVSGDMHSDWFTCQECSATVFVLVARGGSLLAFLPSQVMLKGKPPLALSAWLDNTLIPTWLDREDRIRSFKDRDWREWLTAVFWPRFPEKTALRVAPEMPEGTPERDHWKYRPPRWPWEEGTISYYDCSDEAKQFVDEAFGALRDKIGVFLSVPEGLLADVYPPQMPSVPGIRMFYGVGQHNAWAIVDPELSRTLAVPEDPRVRRNQELFQRVWAEVGRALELKEPFPPVAQVKNAYGGVEPWFKFEMADATFVVSWRHRVINIEVQTPRPLSTADIYRLSQVDRVTYSARGGTTGPSFVNIHADGSKKCIEYLTVLCRAALLSRSTSC